MMKKLMVCVACFVLVLSLAACGGKGSNSAVSGLVGGDPSTWGPPLDTETEDVQIPNPWQTCDSLEEAGELAGFSFTVPETLDGFDEKHISAIENDVAQVIFSNGDNSEAEVTFRKGAGDEDISGDYNEYKTVETQQIDGKTVTVKSNDGVIYTALWTEDGYSYSIFARTGMSAEQMDSWIQALA